MRNESAAAAVADSDTTADWDAGWDAGHQDGFEQVHTGLRAMRPGYHMDTCPCSACETIRAVLRHFAP